MKISSFLIISFFFGFALASGGGDEAAKKPAPKTSEQELQELQGRVQTLKGKVDKREEEVKALSLAAQKEDDPKKKSEIAQKLSIEHSELKKDAKEYNEALYQLKYQYPERGSSKLSEEKMKEIKTLRELEEQQSIEGKIKKNMKSIRRTYGKKDPSEKPKVEEKAPEATEQADPLLQPVIIRK